MHGYINRIIAGCGRRTSNRAQPAVALNLVPRNVSSSLVHHEGVRAGGTDCDGRWSHSSDERRAVDIGERASLANPKDGGVVADLIRHTSEPAPGIEYQRAGELSRGKWRGIERRERAAVRINPIAIDIVIHSVHHISKPTLRIYSQFVRVGSGGEWRARNGR